MSVWTWVLAGLCAAGVLAAVASAIPALIAASQIRKRVAALKQSRLSLALQSMQIQSDRLARLSAQAAPLAQRAQTAVESIRASAETLQLPDARDALADAGAEMTALGRELR